MAALTSDGYDPWGPVFFAIGSASVPLIMASAIAGLIKLFNRELNFFNIFFWVFLVVAAILAYMAYQSAIYG
jgi:hypothetical protein